MGKKILIKYVVSDKGFLPRTYKLLQVSKPVFKREKDMKKQSKICGQ